MKFNGETKMVASILVTSFGIVGTVALNAYPEISVEDIDKVVAPVVVEEEIPVEIPVEPVATIVVESPVIESTPVVVHPETDDQIRNATPPVLGETDPAEENEHTLRLCEMEDSQDCYWDAARLGNTQGRSFVNIDGMVYYLP